MGTDLWNYKLFLRSVACGVEWSKQNKHTKIVIIIYIKRLDLPPSGCESFPLNMRGTPATLVVFLKRGE
jgi:hypothetical protein